MSRQDKFFFRLFLALGLWTAGRVLYRFPTLWEPYAWIPLVLITLAVICAIGAIALAVRDDLKSLRRRM